tara:strand:+ start:278 stop:742 length:465 start_codon:yes stop_codon:yes gene_type:complete
MKLVKQIKKLCSPAYVYLVLSVVGMVAMMFQNAGNTNTYCVGDFECEVPNTAAMFVGKAMYIAFWTFILNALCQAGYKKVSWFIVLIPFILMSILIGMLMLSGGFRVDDLVEGMNEGQSDTTKVTIIALLVLTVIGGWAIAGKDKGGMMAVLFK